MKQYTGRRQTDRQKDACHSACLTNTNNYTDQYYYTDLCYTGHSACLTNTSNYFYTDLYYTGHSACLTGTVNENENWKNKQLNYYYTDLYYTGHSAYQTSTSNYTMQVGMAERDSSRTPIKGSWV